MRGRIKVRYMFVEGKSCHFVAAGGNIRWQSSSERELEICFLAEGDYGRLLVCDEVSLRIEVIHHLIDNSHED